MQGDPVALVHVVSGRDVLVMLAERHAVLRIRLDDHDRLTGDVSDEHEDLVADFEDLPVGPERILQHRSRKLLDAVAGMLLQHLAVHGAPPEITGGEQGYPNVRTTVHTWLDVEEERVRKGKPNDPERRTRILRAALEVIASEGVHAASYRRIAAQAGVPLGSTTYYFCDLETLIVSAFETLRGGFEPRYGAP